MCAKYATDLDFARDQLRQSEDEFHLWNVTSLGNAAFMSLHAPTEELRAGYDALRKRYMAWWLRRERRGAVKLALATVFGLAAMWMVFS